MTANGWFQIGLYFVILLTITKPIGVFMTRVFNREKTFLDPALRPVERLIYLPVCICCERCGGIEGKRLRHVGEVLRIPRQPNLHPFDQIQY